MPPPPANASRVTSLFGNDVLQLLERMRINSSRRFTNRSRGEHLVGKQGSSNEFADYRNYVEGDDVRFVDWNVFARLNKAYMKTYRHEEELHVVLLVDASESMADEGKLELARQLAAAFGVMGLHGGERVSCWQLNSADHVTRLAPARGRAAISKLLAFCENITTGGDMPVEAGIERCLREHRGRGVVILLSDFLTFGDIPKAMSMLFSAGLEIFALQLLGPHDRNPDLGDDVRLVDSETGGTLDVTGVAGLLDLYQEYREAHEATISSACAARGGRFVSLDASDDLPWILGDLLRRMGGLR
jgi:uncharacterized protein (DUF58 family)